MRWLALLMALGFVGCGAFAFPGKPCSKHEDCSGLKNGYCSRAEICSRECSETDPCPEGSSCSTQGARSVCLASCESDATCIKGFVCFANVCVLQAPLDPPPTQ
jgi:hypothetical protein